MTENAHTTLTQYRDVVKCLKAGQQLVILGIENQDQQNYQMPFRVMEMDFINYARQVRIIVERNIKAWEERHDSEINSEIKNADAKPAPTSAEYLSRFLKEDRLKPCITLVIYWGSEPWQGARRLSDMFLESEWSAFASDYEMHLLEVQRIPDSDLDSYNDDLKMIFGFVKYARHKEQLMNFLERNETAFTCVSGTAVDAIAELTHSSELKKVKEASVGTKGGTEYNMCQAIREMIEDGREEGRKEGREKGKEEGIKEGIKKGRKEERRNTEREHQRAVAAERENCELRAELHKLKMQLGLI